jgi:hypothetical protein
MRNVTAAAVAVIIAALLYGCGGNKATTVIVAPGFVRHVAINAELAVVILDEAPQIIYFGDIKKSLGGTNPDKTIDGETLLWEYFIKQLIRDIIREIDVRDAFKAVPSQNYRVTREAVTTSEGDFAVEIPDVGTRIMLDPAQAALVLFLDNIRVGTQTDPFFLERAPQGGFHISTGRRLIYAANFVLWDNREFKPICYGRVQTTAPITREEATIGNWEEVSRDFVRTIFGPTGFRKRERR